MPAFGIVASTLLASLAIVISYLGSSGVTVFTTLVLMIETARFVRDMIVAVLVVVFSALFIWYSRYTGEGFWVYWAPFFLTIVAFALGVPVYRAQRRAMLASGGIR